VAGAQIKMSSGRGAEKATAGPDSRELLNRLAALLKMEERLRRAEKKELPFIIVNETRLLIPYRQAALWRAGDSLAAAPMAVSGLAVFDKNAPYLQWLARLSRHLKDDWEERGEPDSRPFTAADLPDV